MNSFKAPAENLGTINGQTAASLLGAAADIALVIDRRGVIRDLSVSSEELATKNTQKWIGRKWADTVSIDSQEKVRELLEHDSDSESGQRQINHRTDEGENILVLYSTVRIERQRLPGCSWQGSEFIDAYAATAYQCPAVHGT